MFMNFFKILKMSCFPIARGFLRVRTGTADLNLAIVCTGNLHDRDASSNNRYARTCMS